jgi:hypothetical protein
MHALKCSARSIIDCIANASSLRKAISFAALPVEQVRNESAWRFDTKKGNVNMNFYYREAGADFSA